MTNEENLLLNICRSYFSGKELEPFGQIDCNRLYRLAINHNLLGVCHCVFNCNKSLIPQEMQSIFRDKFLDFVLVYEKQSDIYDEIRDCLGKEAIPFVAFKGIVLRELYPVPESRVMGDIDILISPHHEKILKKAFAKAGFKYCNTCDFVDTYKKEGIIVEVHKRLDSEYHNSFDDAFEKAVFTGIEGRLDENCHFAYLVAHTAKHFKSSGVGIRFLLDLAFMLKHGGVELDKVFEILDKSNLTAFAKTLLSVCSIWFDCGEKYTPISQRVLDSFLRGGVFANSFNSEYQTVSRLKTLKIIKEDKPFSPFMLKLRLAFPAYESLKGIPYLSFVIGRRWLVPFAWIYRIIYNLKNRKSQMLKTLKSTGEKETLKLAGEELEFLKEVGLL